MKLGLVSASANASRSRLRSLESGSRSRNRSSRLRSSAPKSGPYQSSSLVHVSALESTSGAKSASRNARVARLSPSSSRAVEYTLMGGHERAPQLSAK